MEKAGSMIWNSVRIAGYFNNFLTFWKPRKLDDGSYVFDLAMEGKPMYGMDVEDLGECVASKIVIYCLRVGRNDSRSCYYPRAVLSLVEFMMLRWLLLADINGGR